MQHMDTNNSEASMIRDREYNAMEDSESAIRAVLEDMLDILAERSEVTWSRQNRDTLLAQLIDRAHAVINGE